MTDVPETPGQKKVKREQNKKLKEQVRDFEASGVVKGLIYKLLSEKLPIMAEVEKLKEESIADAVAAGFDRAWEEFQQSSDEPSDT